MQLLYWLLPTIAVSVALIVAIIYAIRRRLRGGEPTRIQELYAESQVPSSHASQTSKDSRQAAASASVWHCKHCQYENDNHLSFCDLCAESRNAPSVGTKVVDVLIPMYQGVHVPMRRSPHLPPLAPPLQPQSAGAAVVPTRPPTLLQSSPVLRAAAAASAPPSNPPPASSSSMRDSTHLRNNQHSRDAPAAPGISLTGSQRKRVKTEAELTFIRATNSVARGDLAAAFKDLNRALLLEPSNTQVR